MKKASLIAGMLVLAAGAAALGITQYMSRDQRSQTADVAAGAIAAVADAASRMTADNGIYTVVVATRVGQGRIDDRDEQMAVEAAIVVRGSGFADMCTSLPRVRDTINTVIADRIVPQLRAGHAVPRDEFNANGNLILTSLNRLVPEGAVAGVRLVLKPAREARDEGCTPYTGTTRATQAQRAGD